MSLEEERYGEEEGEREEAEGRAPSEDASHGISIPADGWCMDGAGWMGCRVVLALRSGIVCNLVLGSALLTRAYVFFPF